MCKIHNMKKSKKFGKIIIPGGTLPEPHELDVANILVTTGYDVEFLSPSYTKGIFSPDILMGGKKWEIKSPCGQSKRTIENNFRKAQHQSENVIFDLRRIGLSEKVAIEYVKQQFNLRRGKVKCIRIITKDHKMLDLNR